MTTRTITPSVGFVDTVFTFNYWLFEGGQPKLYPRFCTKARLCQIVICHLISQVCSCFLQTCGVFFLRKHKINKDKIEITSTHYCYLKGKGEGYWWDTIPFCLFSDLICMFPQICFMSFHLYNFQFWMFRTQDNKWSMNRWWWWR